MIYDNLPLKKSFKEYLSTRIGNSGKKLKLLIVQIGDDLASSTYINLKRKIGQEIGIFVDHLKISVDTSISEFETILNKKEEESDGVIFQLPIPEKFAKFVEDLNWCKDVDLLSKNNYKLIDQNFLPPTIFAIDLVLKNILHSSLPISDLLEGSLDFKNKTVCIIGQGKLVGKPATEYFFRKNANILIIDKNTENPEKICKQADIVVCGAGRPNLVNKKWLKSDALVIDAATSESEGSLVGDVNIEEIYETNLLVKSPGGIGPLTVLSLFWNLYLLTEL